MDATVLQVLGAEILGRGRDHDSVVDSRVRRGDVYDHQTLRRLEKVIRRQLVRDAESIGRRPTRSNRLHV